MTGRTVPGVLEHLSRSLDLACPRVTRQPWTTWLREGGPPEVAEGDARFALASLPDQVRALGDDVGPDTVPAVLADVVRIAAVLDAITTSGVGLEVRAEALRARAHVLVALSRLAESTDDPVVAEVLDDEIARVDPDAGWQGAALVAREAWLEQLEHVDRTPGLFSRGLDPVGEVVALHLDDGRLAVLAASSTEDARAARDREVALVQDRVRGLVLARADIVRATRLLRATEPAGLLPRLTQRPSWWGAAAILLVGIAVLRGHPIEGAATGVATVLIAVSALLLMADLVRRGAVVTYRWMLRAPAVGGVGFGLVVAFHDGLRVEAASPALRLGVTLASAVVVTMVLLLDARAHASPVIGSDTGLVLRTATHATALTVMHAIVIGLVGTRWVYPVVDELGRVEEVLARTGPDALLTILMTGLLSTAVGVLLQSLWDEEPLTAPLGSLRWR